MQRLCRANSLRVPQELDQNTASRQGLRRECHLLLLEEIRMRDLQTELPLHIQERKQSFQAHRHCRAEARCKVYPS